jgi:all-trans-8'-apo-beta-carotenal 15,15'-oxygenase
MPLPSCMSQAPHQDFDLEVVAGEWPDDISGDVVWSSPSNSHKLPYEIFDWGAIVRLSLEPGKRGAPEGRFRFDHKVIQSPSKRLYDRHSDQFTVGALGWQSPFGAPNCANTAPLPWGDRLYTTWDAGRPVELDPVTMEFVAEVGHVDSWGGQSMPMPGVHPFLFSSAHPVADPERHCLWTVKMTPVMEPTFGMQPAVVRWDRDGTAVKYWPLEGISFSGSVHTLSQTRDWVILCDSGNFKADADEMMGGERTVTTDDEVPVWLIRKEQLEATPTGTPVEPVCFTMSPPNGHYYARYDDTDGISVVWEGMDLMDLALYMRPDDNDVNGNPVDPAVVGLYNMAMAPETITEVTFDPNSGKVLEQGIYKDDWTFNLQLSGMDWSLEGLSHPTLHHVTYQGCRPGNISERAAKMYEGRIDLDQVREETPGRLATFERGSMELKSYWEYTDTSEQITSPTFAPRDAGKGTSDSYEGGQAGGHDGYVVQPILSDSGFRVDLFDAANVGAGPIATLKGTNNEQVPVVLHSAWMPQLSGLVDADRLRFADELSDEAMASVPEELHSSIREVAEECDALL